MIGFKKRKSLILLVTFLLCFSLFVTQAFSLSLEETISRRESVRSYSSGSVPRNQFLDLLKSAYGHTSGQGTTPKIGSDYSLIIYTLTETNSLNAYDLNVNKETIRPYDSNWPSNARKFWLLFGTKTG
jgi:hypothetical protein